jgi:hypothetical protein
MADRMKATSRRVLSSKFKFDGRAQFERLRSNLVAQTSSEMVVYKAIFGDTEELPGASYEWLRIAWPCQWADFQKAARETFKRDYMQGDCPHYAIALHRLHGWPMRGVIIRDRSEPGLQVMHVWAVRPDGMAVDIEGAKVEAELAAYYLDGWGGSLEELSEAEILSWYAKNPEDECWEKPREFEAWVPLEARWLASLLEGEQASSCALDDASITAECTAIVERKARP